MRLHHTCYNRNILECKVIQAKGAFNLGAVIIETFWNVKVKESNATQTALQL